MKGNQVLGKLFSQSKQCINKNSTTILACIGAIGVIATTVTAVKATPKAMELLNKAESEKGEELTKMEVIATAGPAYIPSLVIGASTIACIFGINVLNKRQQASLVSAYALADSTYKEYRGKVKELLGEETDNRIRDAIAKDKRDEEVTGYVPGLGSLPLSGEKLLFYDEYRKSYFEATMQEVLNAEYHLNRNFTMRGNASLNEFYSFLGLEPTDFGEVLGWDSWKLMEEYDATWIDFDHRLTTVSDDGLECYFIEMVFPPIMFEEE